MGQQRLILCLDGTWNQQDSSTNVLHHFNLVREGVIPATGIIQKKYYHTGVGTGVLDGVTGGGFGFGLEKNVRDAYNWLVQSYSDGDGKDTPADEIYIFGFSRGAYTARSLVGFIGQCGLLRRAAPITVAQLWGDYCILGRRREARQSVWDKFFWQPQPRIRPITELVRDPWLGKKDGPSDEGAAPPNESELLLKHWSRRIKITYLGIYDTVGAIGWDALAIPGLTSRLALHNNLRPTTIIQHCRHALAIDEHRSSFQHTPFLAFVGHDAGEREVERGVENPEDQPRPKPLNGEQHWKRTQAMWCRKIEQRWFVGAHSNIGGGYEDNRLAEGPFRWILEGATEIGLESESVAFDPPVTAAEQEPRDSFAEFAPPLWTKVLRAKRNYRVIDPDPQPKASGKRADTADLPAGFSLQTVNESVDKSAFKYWENSKRSAPPNLYEYAQRRKKEFNANPPAHLWLSDKAGEYLALVLWATLAAVGIGALYKLTGFDPGEAGRLWGACLAAFIFPLVDWSESAANFRRALGRCGPRGSAFLDSIYWTRAFGFVLFLCGAVYSIRYLGKLGWQHDWDRIAAIMGLYWPVPASAAAAVIVVRGFRSKTAWASLVLGPAAAAAAGSLLVAAAWFAQDLIRNASIPVEPAATRSVPGLLLLLQLSFIYVWRAIIWTADPMVEAHLGSIVPLQRCFTPAKVAMCLERWRHSLECRWLNEDLVKGPAALRMRDVVREALWRDIIGLIPVYSAVFLFGLWFAATHCRPRLFGFLNLPDGPLSLWWLIPLTVALADYAEDICHLRYLTLNEHGRQPSALLTLFSCVMSGIKGLGVLAAFSVSIAAILDATYQVRIDAPDWRAIIAILISVAFLIAFVVYVAGRIVHALKRPAETGSARQGRELAQ